MKKFVCIVLAISLFLCLFCEGASASMTYTSKVFKSPKVTLQTGSFCCDVVDYQPVEFDIKATLLNLKGAKVSWTSSNSKVVEVVNQTGRVKCKTKGSAKITITAVKGKKKYSASLTITVTERFLNLSTGITLKPYMTDSMKQKSYSQFVVNGSNVGCCAVSMAIGTSILTKSNVSPLTCWSSKRGCAIATKYVSPGKEKSFNAQVVYSELQRGKPVLVHYRNGKLQHWVCLNSVDNNHVAILQLSYKNFGCIDPVTGKSVCLNQAWKFSTSNVKMVLFN